MTLTKQVCEDLPSRKGCKIKTRPRTQHSGKTLSDWTSTGNRRRSAVRTEFYSSIAKRV